MLICQMSSHPPSRRPIQEANLNEERFVDFFNRIRLLGQHGSQRIYPDRPALIFLDYGQKQLAVNLIETVAIHFQHLEGLLRRRFIDLARTPHLRIVAHPPQQAVGNARRAP